MIDDGDSVCDAISFLHVVRGEEDGYAFFLVEILHVTPQVIARLRIETDGRLVEEEDFGMMEKPACDLEPPLHAAGEVPRDIVFAIEQSDNPQQLLHPFPSQCGGAAAQHSMEFQILPRGHLLIETRILEDDAERFS